MSEVDRLKIVLLALLPNDGSLIASATLARVAGIDRVQVDILLEDAVNAGRVAYYTPTYSYRAVKQGDAL